MPRMSPMTTYYPGTGVIQATGYIRVGVVGLGYWGPNLARNFAAIPGCELAWCCDARRGGARALGDRPSRARASPRDLDDLLDDPGARRRRARHAGPDPRAARRARARRRQALLRREAAGLHGRGRRAGGRRRGRRRTHPDGRPPARLPPRRREAQGDRRLGRARRHPLHLLAPPEPRPAAHRRERAVVARRARRLGRPAPRGRGPGRWSRRAARPTRARASRTSCSRSCASRRGVAAHLHMSWLDPHKTRSFTVVGSAPDGDVRRHGARAQGHRLRQGLRRGRALLRRVHHPLRRHPQPADRRTASRCGSSASTSSSASARGARPRSDGEAGLRVVRVLAALQESLKASAR